MNGSSATGAMAAWALTGMIAAAAQIVTSPPGLRFEPAVLELGPVYAHQPVRSDILVINEGDQDIRLDDIGKSCPDCLEVFPGQTRLAPGETTVLGVWFDPGGTPGDVSEYVVVDPDVSTPRTQVLEVRASVSSAYRIEDGSLLLEAREPQDAVTSGVRVVPLYPMKGQLASGRSLGDRTRVELSVDADRPGAYRVCVSAVTPVAPGWTEDEILLESSDPADPPCRIPASVFLMPPIHVYPARLRVAPLDREQLRILFVESQTGEPVELVSVDGPEQYARWEYFPGYGLERSRLNVYVYGARGLEGEVGAITLHLRGAEDRMARIPLVVDATQERYVYYTGTRVPLGSRKGCDCGS